MPSKSKTIADMGNDSPLGCDFCGQPRSESRRIIQGNMGAVICSECVDLCNDIIESPLTRVERKLDWLLAGDGICRECGCTEERACMTDNGPCHWVEPGLCSAHQ